MGSMGYPNYSEWLLQAWGAGQELSTGALIQTLGQAGNFVYGTNPPYYLDDFAAFYPKFFGLPLTLSNCQTTSGSADVTVPSANGLLIGQFVQSGNFPKGTTIQSINGNVVTMNQGASATSAAATLQVYSTTAIPTFVIQSYINLAVASLVQARWQDLWVIAIGWFVAHYCTLYAQTDATELTTALQTVIHGEAPAGAIPGTVYTLSANPPAGTLQALTKNGSLLVPGADYTLSGVTITLAASTGAGDVLWAFWPVLQQVTQPSALSTAQIAAQGIATGIQVSKGVGDVSVGYQALASLEAWGQWNLTKYGQQLVTNAEVIGAGPALIY